MRFSNCLQSVFGLMMLGCALRPFVFPDSGKAAHPSVQLEQNWAFERWHNGFSRLWQLPLTAVEQRFAHGFPGAIARFTDGNKIWVVRHLTEPTRMLHSAMDCFRGLGYQVKTAKVVEQSNGRRWRCFLAQREQNLQVCEHIFDADNNQWTDVSAWYWETLFQSGQHQWWAVTQVTHADAISG